VKIHLRGEIILAKSCGKKQGAVHYQLISDCCDRAVAPWRGPIKEGRGGSYVKSMEQRTLSNVKSGRPYNSR